MIDKLSIHRSKYWQKEMCHWKNHQSSNYHVSMLSGKRCETSKCVNTDYFISTSYQLYCEHQCLNVYSAAGWLLQANTLTWHPESSNLWWNHVCFLQKWAAKQILDISRRSDRTGIKPEDREGLSLTMWQWLSGPKRGGQGTEEKELVTISPERK